MNYNELRKEVTNVKNNKNRGAAKNKIKEYVSRDESYDGVIPETGVIHKVVYYIELDEEVVAYTLRTTRLGHSADLDAATNNILEYILENENLNNKERSKG